MARQHPHTVTSTSRCQGGRHRHTEGCGAGSTHLCLGPLLPPPPHQGVGLIHGADGPDELSCNAGVGGGRGGREPRRRRVSSSGPGELKAAVMSRAGIYAHRDHQPCSSASPRVFKVRDKAPTPCTHTHSQTCPHPCTAAPPFSPPPSAPASSRVSKVRDLTCRLTMFASCICSQGGRGVREGMHAPRVQCGRSGGGGVTPPQEGWG